MENLYMFAIMPPAGLAARIHNERENFAEKYKCTKALKPPVHITMYRPFNESVIIEQQFKKLQNWAGKQTPFTIELKNYNYFNIPDKPVIYIDVVKNDTLNTLHKTFLVELRKMIDVTSSNKKYAPHFTIGYRDIPPSMLPAIKVDYSKKRFDGSFTCNAVYLWKHDGKNWQTIQEYVFGIDNEPKPLTLF